MASTYSPLLRLELIGSGDQAGLWGTTTNNNLGSLIEQAVAGVASITLSSTADYTLSNLNGAPDEARAAVLNFSGTTGGTTNIIIPASTKLYVVRNNTSHTLHVKTAAQSSYAEVLAGDATLVFCDGTSAVLGIVSANVGTLSVAGGGTGKTTFTAGFLKSPGTTSAFTTSATVNLATETTGTLAVTRGGTGLTSFTANALFVADGTGTAISGITGGANIGYALTWNGTNWGTGAVGVAGGGTGKATFTAGIVRSSGGTAALTTSTTIDAGTELTGVAPLANGGTGRSTYTAGIVRYAAGGTALSTSTTVSAATELSGVTPVANGGTGGSTFTAGFVKASGASAFTTVSTIALNSDVSNVLPVGNGGTGLTSFIANALFVANGTGNAISGLTGTVSGQVATWNGANWAASAVNVGTASGTLGIANGGTGQTTFTAGFVKSTGGITALSTVSKIDASNDMTGTMPVGNGGTGVTTFTAGFIKSSGGVNSLSSSAKVDASTEISNTLKVENGGTGNATFSTAGFLKTGGGTAAFTTASTIALNADVSNTLPVANGGTGNASFSTAGFVKANGTTPLTTVAKVDLTTDVSNILPVVNGGTGLTTYTANAIITANGTGTGLLGSGLTGTIDGQIISWSGSLSKWVVSAAPAAGVLSFNSRTGTVTPQAGDYSSFFVGLTGTNTVSSANAFNGNNTFSGTNSFSATSTFTGAINSSGTNTFSGATTFSGNNTFGITGGSSTNTTTFTGILNSTIPVTQTKVNTSYANVKITRETTGLTGGTGQICGAQHVYTKTGTGTSNYEWNLLAQIDNNAATGENVALYAQANQLSTGPTWGAVVEICNTNANNAQTVGQEITFGVTGNDSIYSNRVGLNIVVTDGYYNRYGVKSSSAVGSVGLRLNCGVPNTTYARWAKGIVIQDVLSTGICIDVGQANNDGTSPAPNALKLASNQYILGGSIYAGTTSVPTINGNAVRSAGFFMAQDSQYLASIFDQGSQTDVNLAPVLINNRTAAGSTQAILFTKDSYQYVGAIINNGSTVQFATPSDYRLKNVSGSIVGAAETVKKLNPVQFTWKDNETLGVQNGFLAHELQSVIPQAVSGEKDALRENGEIKPQTISATELIPVLTAALKEALLRIEVLEAKLGV